MSVACGQAFWVSDQDRLSCAACTAEFGLFVRRHHCRRCGEVFCHACSAFTAPLRSLDGRDLGEQRVCAGCRDQLQAAPRRAAAEQRDRSAPRRRRKRRGDRQRVQPDDERASSDSDPELDPEPELDPDPDPDPEPDPDPQPAEPEPEPAPVPEPEPEPEPEPAGLKALEYRGASLPPKAGQDIVIREDGGVVESRSATPAVRLAPQHRLQLELVRQVGPSGFHRVMSAAYASERGAAAGDIEGSISLLGQLDVLLGGMDAEQKPLVLRGVTQLLSGAMAMTRPSLDLDPWLYSLGFDHDFAEVFSAGLIKVVMSNRLGGPLGAMAMGADAEVSVLAEEETPKLLLGPPLKESDKTMPLLEFDVGPEPARPFAPRPGPSILPSHSSKHLARLRSEHAFGGQARSSTTWRLCLRCRPSATRRSCCSRLRSPRSRSHPRRPCQAGWSSGALWRCLRLRRSAGSATCSWTPTTCRNCRRSKHK